MQYAWLVWSLILLAIWGAIFLFLKSRESRKEMFWTSVWTSLAGLSEPFFVPAYWLPPSLFNLAEKTGFDIESLLFSFGVGGLAVVIYESVFPVRHEALPAEEKERPRHRYHLLALLSAPLIFFTLYFSAPINPIYSAFIGMLGGGIFAIYCRPDLAKRMVAGSFVFLGLYFFYFQTLILAYPGYVEKVWNLAAISGILVIGVPLEELMFALGLGFLWSGVYEHVTWRRIIQNHKNP